MIKTYITQGIVLRQRDWRESDRLFIVYTKDFGKLQLVAPGIKKIKSKLAGHLATPGLIDLMIVKTKSFDKIGSAYLKDVFNLDLEKDYLYLSMVYELFDIALDLAQPDEKNWELLMSIIDNLSKTKKDEHKQLAVFSFMFNLLNNLGYKPEFEKCIKCSKSSDNLRFSLSENGLLCKNCQSLKTIRITSEMIELIKIIYSKKQLNGLSIKKRTFKEMFIFIKEWVPYVLEKKVKSFQSI